MVGKCLEIFELEVGESTDVLSTNHDDFTLTLWYRLFNLLIGL